MMTKPVTNLDTGQLDSTSSGKPLYSRTDVNLQPFGD
jgi:hypothetical protein